MDNESSTNELYAMREQLMLLEQERLARQRESTSQEAAAADRAPAAEESLPPDLSSRLGENGDIDAQAVLADLKAGAGRWLAALDEDLKDTKPSTLLLVFGLGVMVGIMTA